MLFVGNDASSPEIAANLLRRQVGDRVEVLTAGAQVPEPGGRADDILVQMGLNPASEERLSVRSLNVADRVVVLGTGLDVARMAGRRYEEWDVENEDLAERVRRLGAELLQTGSAGSGSEVAGAAARLSGLRGALRPAVRLARVVQQAARRAVTSVAAGARRGRRR